MTNIQTVTITEPGPEVLANASQMLELARSYTIDCPEMREAAADDLKRVKTLANELESQRKSITAPLDLAKKRVMDLFRKPGEFLELAETTLKRACIAWDQEQERKRQLAAAEAARKADEERKRLAEEAAKQEAAGNTETAAAIQQASLFVAPAPVPAAPKIAGESTRDAWSAELVDIIALAQAVAEQRVPADYLLPNMPVLNGVARALKGSMSVPGVRVVSTKVLATKAA